MKPLKLALLIVAFICFVLAIYFDWRPLPPPGVPAVWRPGFMSMGLAFWVLSEILS